MKVADKISKIFLANTDETQWIRIIIWWEVRRLLYNFFLVLFLALVIAILSVIPNEGYIKLITGPTLALGIYVIIIIYFIAANVCYTGGMIIQLVSRNIESRILKKHISKLFFYGLAVSFAITIILPLILWLINLITGILLTNLSSS